MDRKFLQQNTASYRIFSIFNNLLMVLLCIIFLYPLLNVIANSMSGSNNVIAGNITFYPEEIDLTAYRMIFSNPAIGSGYLNSIFYASVGTLCNIILISLTAYALSKKRLVLRSFFSFFIAFTMLFSGGLIPTFLVVRFFGLYNTRTWIIFSQLFSVWFIIMLRTFYQNIPESLEDSAKIDGYNDIQIMFKIYMPLSMPILATLSLFSIVGYWNDYFTSLIYLNDAAKYPLQIILRDFIIPGRASYTDIFYHQIFALERLYDWGPHKAAQLAINLKNASIISAALPLVTVMMAVQRYFKKGVLIGAIKD